MEPSADALTFSTAEKTPPNLRLQLIPRPGILDKKLLAEVDI